MTGDKTRRLVLKELATRKIRIYLLIIDKQGRKIKDSPGNYAVLIARSLEKVLDQSLKLEHVIIDRHFTFVTQKQRFNDLLQRNFKRELFIEHLDSRQNPIVSLADFVAGAARTARVHGDDRFRKIIKEIIVEEDTTTWRKIKQKAVNL